MKVLPIRLAPEAEADLAAIEWWIGDQAVSSEAARRYGDRIRSRCNKIGLAPLGGRLRTGLGHDLRSVSFERTATIYYRVEPGRVLILRILRRGRDVAGQFTP